MKFIINQVFTYLSLVSIILICGISIIDWFDIYPAIRMGKIFGFAYLLIPISIIGAIFTSIQRSHSITKIDIAVVLLYCYILIRNCAFELFSDERFYWMIGVLPFYFLVKTVFKQLNRIQIRIFFFSLGLLLIYHSIIGLMQLYGFSRGNYKGFITGVFFNPAPYSAFLIAIFPFIIGAILEFRKFATKKGAISILKCFQFSVKSVFIIAALLFILVIPVTYSRAGWLAAASGLAAILLLLPYSQRKLRSFTQSKRGKTIIVLTAFIGIVSLGGIYSMKKDSANGRLLIWKITTQQIKDAPFVGAGFNSFEAEYSNNQAEYFVGQSN